MEHRHWPKRAQEGPTHDQVRQKAAVGPRAHTHIHRKNDGEGHGSQSSVRTKYSRAYPGPSLKGAIMNLAPVLELKGWGLKFEGQQSASRLIPTSHIDTHEVA